MACSCSSHSQTLLSRRNMLAAGSIGLAGLSTLGRSSVSLAAPSHQITPKKSVIFVWMTGGLSQHDSFDPKPNAPDTIRGEFDPIATQTPGLFISEHLPKLAARSERWGLVRSMETNSSGHGPACHMILTGRRDLPPGFDTNGPTPNDWPSLGTHMTYFVRPEHSLPSAVVLPQPSVNEAAKVRPGQYSGRLGKAWEAWHVNIAAQCPLGNGACPNCFRFDEDTFEHASNTIFDTPFLTLPEGGSIRLKGRLDLLSDIEGQRFDLEAIADVQKLGRNREQAVTVLADQKTREAFSVENADPKLVARYGKNKFGLSVLMARHLSEAGVPYVQVNLGKNSTWDTHRRNFVNLRRNLLPYLDQCMSALLDDLADSGRLDETLVVLTGEFGRTPKINNNAGRDHWGPLNSVLFAGAGVEGGKVVGSSDKTGSYVQTDLQTPETFAATLYNAVGIPRDSQWIDIDGRPHELYRGEPISDLFS